MRLPKSDTTTFEVCPGGTYAATCCRVIDLGTQTTKYNGKPKSQRKVYLEWQLTELDAEGLPFYVGERYTLSSSEKATLRKHLEAWRGKRFTEDDFGDHEGAFDIRSVLGAPCLLSITQSERDGKTYANIASLGRLPKEMRAPVLVADPVYFSLDEFDHEVFDSFSDRLKETIERSPEFEQVIAHTQAADTSPGFEDAGDDDGPF